jgi:hypothetical protein
MRTANGRPGRPKTPCPPFVSQIEKNEPEVGLDRLHTFIVKFVRMLCEQRGIPIIRDKALHSLFGEYVKRLRDSGHIKSDMTARSLSIRKPACAPFVDSCVNGDKVGQK